MGLANTFDLQFWGSGWSAPEWTRERKRGRAYGQDLRERVFLAADAGTSVGAVSKMLMVSVSYVSKVLGRRRRSGETTPPPVGGESAALCDRVSTCQDATLAELRLLKVAANTTLVWETLKTLKLTRKKDDTRHGAEPS